MGSVLPPPWILDQRVEVREKRVYAFKKKEKMAPIPKRFKKSQAARRIKKSIQKKYAKAKMVKRGKYLPSPPRSTGRKIYDAIIDPIAGVTTALGNPLTAMGIEAGMRFGGAVYDRLTKTAPKYRSGGVAGTLGGKVSPGKKFAGKKSRNPSIPTLLKKGITLNYESRKTFATGSEAVVIGHTSMPGKVCSINMWRAIVKALMLECGMTIKDYGNNMTNDGFSVGDQVNVIRYNNATSPTLYTDFYAITLTSSYDAVADYFANLYNSATDFYDEKLDAIDLVPITTGRIQYARLDLSTLKITVFTKSTLKIQNTTNETIGDNEADDITAVPLVGNVYGCRGNNMLRKSNAALLTGFFGSTQNEECLHADYSRQIGTVSVGSSVAYYAAGTSLDNNQTTFLKPAEPPKQYELANCYSMAPCALAPGQLKESVLTQKYTFGLQYYFNLLYGTRNNSNSLLVYNPKQGKTNVVYLEKAMGRKQTADNGIKLWVELDFKQSALVHGSAAKMTLPIQYQTDYD